jgi:hypothetical protein
MILFTQVAAIIYWAQGGYHSSDDAPPMGLLCKNPPIRREWRALTPEEKMEYIDAVNCLSRTPATWGENGSVYDDFTRLHSGAGADSTSLNVFEVAAG